FSEQSVFKSVKLDSPVLNDEGLGWLLFGKLRPGGFKFEHVSATNARLDSKTVSLPAFIARGNIGEDGGWQKVTLESSDSKVFVELKPGGGRVHIEIDADAFALPFGSALVLESFNAKGTAGRN